MKISMLQPSLFALHGSSASAPDTAADSDAWYTPAPIIHAARAVLGRIDTDPASSVAAQAVVQASVWYDLCDDGLTQPWRRSVWLNPPYSNPLPWVKRFVAHCGEPGNAGIILVNCACSPEWAELLWAHGHAMCLFADRIRFWHPAKSSGSGDRDNMACYIGGAPAVFREQFGAFGRVVLLQEAVSHAQ